MPQTKKSHLATKYGRGHQKGEHCGACIQWDPPHCKKVVDPMPYQALGWCNLFERKPFEVPMKDKWP